jgi:hypothetical protein
MEPIPSFPLAVTDVMKISWRLGKCQFNLFMDDLLFGEMERKTTSLQRFSQARQDCRMSGNFPRWRTEQSEKNGPIFGTFLKINLPSFTNRPIRRGVFGLAGNKAFQPD